MRTYQYYRDVFAGIPKPFAFLDMDVLDENIEQILDHSRGKHIRLATKSIRSIRVIKHILARGGRRMRGVMGFTAPEALYLAENGIDDILLGYPVWEPRYITEMAKHVRDGRQITLMVDSPAHVEHIDALAQAQEVELPVCLDVDMSMPLPGLHFGVWRSPVRTVPQAEAMVRRIAASKHVRLDGVMGYEAQIAGVTDRDPGQRVKNGLIRWLKRRSVRAVALKRAALVRAIDDMGATLRFVNGGGTGSLKTTGMEACVTEVTVGSGFYAPGLFDHYRDFRYAPAAGFAIEIVRQPRPDTYTCAGGGYVASGAAGADKLPVPFLPRGARLTATEGAGEVQTPVRYSGDGHLALGDPIFMRHSKAGELCERFDRLLCVSDGKIVDEMPTYRGEGKCFL